MWCRGPPRGVVGLQRVWPRPKGTRAMDFSLHEQRRLAVIEQELSGDRRLKAMMSVLGSDRSQKARRLRIVAVRVRHPRRADRDFAVVRPRFGRLLLVVTVLLALACPATLITALALGLPTLALVAIMVLPLPPLLVLMSFRRLRGTLPRRP